MPPTRNNSSNTRLLTSIRVATLMLRLAHVQRLFWKAGFRPDQVPAGQPDGGQWTEEDGDADLILASHEDPGELPEIPQQRPPTTRERNSISVRLARFLFAADVAVQTVRVSSWVWEHARDRIIAYLEQPKFLDQLQRAVGEPKPGYDKHHIAEKTSARQDGFSEELIEGWRNPTLIPTYRHWEITAWYATRNEEFDWLSPREYLRGKSWEERYRVGLHALRLHGVLK